jgi:hypothetical protein
MQQQQPDQNRPWTGLNLAVIIAAGLMCLVAGAAANAESSCTIAMHGVGSSDCKSDLDRQKISPAVRSLRAKQGIDGIGVWAFILPGARAFSLAAIPTSLRLQVPQEPHSGSVVGGAPLFRIAPKTSPPIA